MPRADYTAVGDQRGGCDVCHGRGTAHWQGANAMAVAARHHGATGHPTWAEQVISAWWGERPPADSAPLEMFGDT